MCQACDSGDDFFQDDEEENFLEQIPEHEREEFFTYACDQFNYMINQASERDMLYQLITEWSRERQAAFTLACVMQRRAESFKDNVLGEDN